MIICVKLKLVTALANTHQQFTDITLKIVIELVAQSMKFMQGPGP